MMEQPGNPHKHIQHERATYRYLSALDDGDLDTIAEVLQQSLYDPTLEQMVLDVHQAYFQETQQAPPVSSLPRERDREHFAVPPIQPVSTAKQVHTKRNVPLWMRTLVAVLVVGLLIGSFLVFMNVRQERSGPTARPTATPVCKPYNWREFALPKDMPVYRPFNNSVSSFNSITIVSNQDAWAVGASIARWNGQKWHLVAGSIIPDNDSMLYAVDALSAENVWAVGYFSAQTASQNQQGLLSSRTLVKHWDGRKWNVIPSPNGPTGNGQLEHLKVISSDDIWATGTYFDKQSSGYIPHPLFLHWNGTRWQSVSLQKTVPEIGGTYSIAASSKDDVWFFGRGRNGNETGYHVLTHWNGRNWQRISLPSIVEQPATWVPAIATTSAGELWLVAQDESPAHSPQVLFHWNKGQWRTIPLPKEASGTGVSITSLTTDEAGNVWIVVLAKKTMQTFTLRWDGKNWQRQPLPKPHGLEDNNNTLGESLVIKNGQSWIVGNYVNANTSENTPATSFILGQNVCP